VMALNRDSPDQILKARSDASGHASFTLDKPGDWLVKAVHMIPARPGKNTDWESFWASVTFELGPPPAAASTPAASPSTSAAVGPPPEPAVSPGADRRLPIAGGLFVVLIVLAVRRRRRASED